MDSDGQFVTNLKARSPEVQGTAICHLDGKCSVSGKFIDIYQRMKDLKGT